MTNRPYNAVAAVWATLSFPIFRCSWKYHRIVFRLRCSYPSSLSLFWSRDWRYWFASCHCRRQEWQLKAAAMSFDATTFAAADDRTESHNWCSSQANEMKSSADQTTRTTFLPVWSWQKDQKDPKFRCVLGPSSVAFHLTRCLRDSVHRFVTSVALVASVFLAALVAPFLSNASVSFL